MFIPLFLMGGYVGLLFREFAVTVTVALVLSLVISLTLTPMSVRPPAQAGGQRARMALSDVEHGFDRLLALYESGLKVVTPPVRDSDGDARARSS